LCGNIGSVHCGQSTGLEAVNFQLERRESLLAFDFFFFGTAMALLS